MGGFSVAGDGAGGFAGARSDRSGFAVVWVGFSVEEGGVSVATGGFSVAGEADEAGGFAVVDGFAVVNGVEGGFAVEGGGLSAVAVLGLSGFAVASVLGGFAVAGS